jgi:hypothetical protein
VKTGHLQRKRRVVEIAILAHLLLRAVFIAARGVVQPSRANARVMGRPGALGVGLERQMNLGQVEGGGGVITRIA